jgi:hypothetical protein
MADEATPPRGRRRLVDRLYFDLGATAQAIVPGAYAWLVTVEPAAFARGAPDVSKVAAALGLSILLLAPALERRRPAAARVASIWGFVGTSLVVWIAAPASFVAPAHGDVFRGMAGLVGWGLFALASAAPALRQRPRDAAPSPVHALKRRGDSGRLDVMVLGVGIAGAVALQGIGWDVAGTERAVLVRLVALCAGVMLVGASASLVAARHSRRTWGTPARRVKRALLPLVLFGLLAVAGAVYTIALGR